MKIFPTGPIVLGTMAVLELGEVKGTSEGKTARYRVRPKDMMAFTATFSGAGPRMGLRYEPVRGALWGALDVPEDRDEVRYGVAMAQARNELQPKAESVFPESSVRALIRGILDREGQR